MHKKSTRTNSYSAVLQSQNQYIKIDCISTHSREQQQNKIKKPITLIRASKIMKYFKINFRKAVRKLSFYSDGKNIVIIFISKLTLEYRRTIYPAVDKLSSVMI